MQAWVDLYMFKMFMLSSILNVPYLMDVVHGKKPYSKSYFSLLCPVFNERR